VGGIILVFPSGAGGGDPWSVRRSLHGALRARRETSCRDGRPDAVIEHLDDHRKTLESAPAKSLSIPERRSAPGPMSPVAGGRTNGSPTRAEARGRDDNREDYFTRRAHVLAHLAGRVGGRRSWRAAIDETALIDRGDGRPDAALPWSREISDVADDCCCTDAATAEMPEEMPDTASLDRLERGPRRRPITKLHVLDFRSRSSLWRRRPAPPAASPRRRP